MDMRKLMKQAQQAQAKLAKVQEELGNTSLEGSASGLVTVQITGQGQITGIRIKPEAVDPEDVEALEDLILVAIQDAQAKSEALQQEAQQKNFGNMPGLGNLF